MTFRLTVKRSTLSSGVQQALEPTTPILISCSLVPLSTLLCACGMWSEESVFTLSQSTRSRSTAWPSVLMANTSPAAPSISASTFGTLRLERWCTAIEGPGAYLRSAGIAQATKWVPAHQTDQFVSLIFGNNLLRRKMETNLGMCILCLLHISKCTLLMKGCMLRPGKNHDLQQLLWSQK